jgi:hypothetical protein
MLFDRTLLPDPVAYFEHQGLTLKGPPSSRWKTITCNFHGGSSSMRVNVTSSAWVSMICCVKGGDALAYEIKASSSEIVDAAKALCSYVNDSCPQPQAKPTPLSLQMALLVAYVLRFDPLSLRFGHTRCAGDRMSGLTRTQADTFRK